MSSEDARARLVDALKCHEALELLWEAASLWDFSLAKGDSVFQQRKGKKRFVELRHPPLPQSTGASQSDPKTPEEPLPAVLRVPIDDRAASNGPSYYQVGYAGGQANGGPNIATYKSKDHTLHSEGWDLESPNGQQRVAEGKPFQVIYEPHPHPTAAGTHRINALSFGAPQQPEAPPNPTTYFFSLRHGTETVDMTIIDPAEPEPHEEEALNMYDAMGYLPEVCRPAFLEACQGNPVTPLSPLKPPGLTTAARPSLVARELPHETTPGPDWTARIDWGAMPSN